MKKQPTKKRTNLKKDRALAIIDARIILWLGHAIGIQSSILKELGIIRNIIEKDL